MMMKMGFLAPYSSTILTPPKILPKFYGFSRIRFYKTVRNPSFLFRIDAISRSITRPIAVCSSNQKPENAQVETRQSEEISGGDLTAEEKKNVRESWNVEVGSPSLRSHLPAAKMSLNDKAFFLLTFTACTTSVAFTSLVIATIPTLYAMGRAAISMSKLADTVREELPSTMAAIRLSGMEISDLTLELSDLSREVTDGVNKSAQAVKAAEAGVRKIGSLARQQTMSMIEERANLPTISLQPVVTGAAKKTSRAVSQATKSLMNMLSGVDKDGDDEHESSSNRLV
ncbi:uncharacterized protein LOC124931549 [Impatiens glandulifera]|uniref:uncharacterized protein LOC124931549 n=1 Tax=Impatiens glandulifera TaxID=253017 RepID=UPI001FB097FD|nr:uncharacterized protein LOC124931549 [Impatiens glandulifera]